MADKTSRKKKKGADRKKKLDIALSIALIVVFFGTMTVAIIITKTKQKKEADNAPASTLMPEKDYSENSAAYSAGLNDDGTISGIKDISEYVSLPEDLSFLVQYEKDYPTEDDMGVYEAGRHLIDLVAEKAVTVRYEPYYEKLFELYDYIGHSWYNSYAEAHRNVEDENKYTSFEDYLQYSEGLTPAQFEVVKKYGAEGDMKHFLVLQALAERFEVKVSDEDVRAYARVMDEKTEKHEYLIDTMISRFGSPYMHQRAAEYLISKLLVEKAEKNAGSIKDQWEDESLFYSAGLYDNGRISGIGDISLYITLADEAGFDAKNASGDVTKAYIDYMLENSEFKIYQDYLETIEALYVHTDGGKASDHEKEAEELVKYNLLMQAVFETRGLDMKESSEAFGSSLTYKEKEKLIFVHGNAYYNQRVIEYAVKQYIGSKYSK